MTITIELLEKTINTFDPRKARTKPKVKQTVNETLRGRPKHHVSLHSQAVDTLFGYPLREMDEITRYIIGGRPALEMPEELTKLKSALSHISSDVGRGGGSIFDSAGNPVEDYWLGVIWAGASLGWDSSKEVFRQWSKQSDRYDDDGFEKAWNGYDATKSNAIGIGSLYKLAKSHGWTPNADQTVLGDLSHATEPGNVTHETSTIPKFHLLDRHAIHNMKPTTWVVKGLFPSEGLVVLYGPSGSGKSFLAFDLAAAIAQGTKWFDLTVASLPVVYVALEGEGGYKNRLAAWEHEHGRHIPDSLKFVLQPFKLTDPDDVQELSRVLPQKSVVIIDTLNRAAPTTDENSSKDMGILLESCKALQRSVKGLVMLVAHTGKDTTKGLRGHSSLFAALDGAIEVVKTNDKRAWEIAKAKDGIDSIKFPFKLKMHPLGQDQDNDPITSCTVERDLDIVFVPREPRGKAQKEALKHLRHQITARPISGKASSGKGACMGFDDAVLSLAPTLLSTAKNKQTNRARQLINDLVKGEYLNHGLQGEEGWLWL